jgi:hypothetical protein
MRCRGQKPEQRRAHVLHSSTSDGRRRELMAARFAMVVVVKFADRASPLFPISVRRVEKQKQSIDSAEVRR